MGAMKQIGLLVILGVAAGVAVSANAGSYKVTDLSQMFPLAFGGFKINNAGQLMSAAYGDGMSLPNKYTFIYADNVTTRIETPLSVSAQGVSINDLGDVIGTTDTNGNAHVFQYRGGVFTDLHGALGTLAGYSSFGTGINNAGQIAGYTTYHTSIGFVVSDGKTTGLYAAGSEATTNGINNFGQITGAYRSIYGSFHAYLYSNDSKIDLGSLTPATKYDPNDASTGVSVNDAVQVVGSSKVKAVGEHAFLYQSGAMIDLGTLGGANSYPTQINNTGVIVGRANIKDSVDYRAFIYSDGQMLDLNSLVDAADPLASTILLTTATGINGRGVIVATGTDKRMSGVERYYLLTPITAPIPTRIPNPNLAPAVPVTTPSKPETAEAQATLAPTSPVSTASSATTTANSTTTSGANGISESSPKMTDRSSGGGAMNWLLLSLLAGTLFASIATHRRSSSIHGSYRQQAVIAPRTLV